MRYILLMTAVAAIALFAEDDPGRTIKGPAPAGAKLYEGRTAVDWAGELLKIDFNRVRVGDVGSEEYEHIRHAMAVLGRESLKPLAAILRKVSGTSAQPYIAAIFMELKIDPKEPFTSTLFELLKDEHYSVRRLTIEMLSQEVFLGDPKAEAAIKEQLKDRDLAVVEAAEGALERIKSLREQKAQEKAALEEQLKAEAKLKAEAATRKTAPEQF